MGAIISKCGQYRYALSRKITAGACTKPPVVFVMLNPSTADAELDDPTIRRCMYFAAREGHTGLIVVNLYAYRATDPGQLLKVPDPVGPKNDVAIAKAATGATDVVFAWGRGADPLRVSTVVRLIAETNPNAKRWCLGITKDHSPRHPLYLKKEADLWPYPPAFYYHPESDCAFVAGMDFLRVNNSADAQMCHPITYEEFLARDELLTRDAITVMFYE